MSRKRLSMGVKKTGRSSLISAHSCLTSFEPKAFYANRCWPFATSKRLRLGSFAPLLTDSFAILSEAYHKNLNEFPLLVTRDNRVSPFMKIPCRRRRPLPFLGPPARLPHAVAWVDLGLCPSRPRTGMAKIEDHGASFDCFCCDIMLPGVEWIRCVRLFAPCRAYKSAPIYDYPQRKHDLMDTRHFRGRGDRFHLQAAQRFIAAGARGHTGGMLSDSLRRVNARRHHAGGTVGLNEGASSTWTKAFDLNVVGAMICTGFEKTQCCACRRLGLMHEPFSRVEAPTNPQYLCAARPC